MVCPHTATPEWCVTVISGQSVAVCSGQHRQHGINVQHVPTRPGTTRTMLTYDKREPWQW
jgi:hypothetical protein